MSIGFFIRQMLGPFERPISELYRSIFVDLTAFVDQINNWVIASNILEVGCGEGAVTEQLVQAYPNARITGIDITPRIGRMFKGELNRVTFKQQTIEEFVANNSACFDLLVISDVMHHIPLIFQKEFLKNAKKALQPGGYLVLKDWERNNTPIHLLCYLLDRYITGDRVCYQTADEFRIASAEVFGYNSIKDEKRIRPWSNNIAFLIQV